MAALQPYGQFLLGQFNGAHPVDWDSDTIKIGVLDLGYTPDIDADEFWGDVSAHESTANGDYTAGGVTLTSCSASWDSANNRLVLDADDIAWTTTTVGRYLVVFKDTGTDATSPLIGYWTNGVNFGGGPTLDVTWDASGVLRASV